MKQPVKISNSLETIIKVTTSQLEAAKTSHQAMRTSAANEVMAFFLASLAQTMLTAEQQQQIQTIVTLWKECCSPFYVDGHIVQISDVVSSTQKRAGS